MEEKKCACLPLSNSDLTAQAQQQQLLGITDQLKQNCNFIQITYACKIKQVCPLRICSIKIKSKLLIIYHIFVRLPDISFPFRFVSIHTEHSRWRSRKANTSLHITGLKGQCIVCHKPSLPDSWEKTAALPNSENRKHTTHPAQNREKNGFMKLSKYITTFPSVLGHKRQYNCTAKMCLLKSKQNPENTMIVQTNIWEVMLLES